VERAAKAAQVTELKEVFKTTNTVVVAHYAGLTVAQMQVLRKQARQAGTTVKVAKNRLAKIALEGTDVASIGTVVHATELATSKQEKFTILGAWDFDAEKGIISYLTPVGQALLNRKVGDEVECEVDGVRHRYRVESIMAYKTAA